MIQQDDWRLRGQEEYLQNEKFQYKQFVSPPTGSLHTHCEFCWHKFMEHSEGVKDCSKEGYCSFDGKYWICEECFQDFKEKFQWNLVD